MKFGLIIVAILAVLVLFIGGKFVTVNNTLTPQREAIKAQWSQVDVALQRRADLIPNLVNTVKGFAAQEKSVIDSVTNARAALVGARTPGEKIQANNQLDSALARLLVVVENYPQLRSNENFMNLQNELAGTENRIAVERRKYNEAVQTYNTTLGLFPNNLIAGFLNFQRDDNYFKTDAAARTTPEVKF